MLSDYIDGMRWADSMNTDLYEATKSNTFLLVPAGGNPAGLPADILERLGRIHFLRTLELDGPELAGADPKAIRADLGRRGYLLLEADIDPQKNWRFTVASP